MIERFEDGNMADVLRIDDIVRKQRPPWWAASRQVLEYLQRVEFKWSPRIVAERDSEIDLTYVPGHTIPAGLDSYESEDWLIKVGSLAREMHDALEGFQPQPGAEFVPWPIEPKEKAILCHNDFSPWNTVVQDGEINGLIDWDLVSMGTREWELAWICWRWAPIYPLGSRTGFDAHEQARRCRILLDAYGTDRLILDGFVDLIDQRMQCAVDVVEMLGAQGVPGFDRLLTTGMHLSGHDDRAWLADHRDTFVSVIG